MFSDKDLINRKDKDYSIIPFKEENIHPIGYDLTMSDLIFSKKNGLITLDNQNNYVIKPLDTIHILTNEIIWLSGRVSGTLHSRTSLAFKGFSNISTTVDPKWIGQLLVTMTNMTNNEITLKKDRPFCTLNIHKLNTPTETELHKKSFITSYLTEEINKQNNEYFKKVQEFITKEELDQFKKILSKKNIKELSELKNTITKNEKIDLFYKLVSLVYYFFLIACITLIIYSIFKWDFFAPFFPNIEYDTTVFTSQISTLLLFVFALINRK